MQSETNLTVTLYTYMKTNNGGIYSWKEGKSVGKYKFVQKAVKHHNLRGRLCLFICPLCLLLNSRHVQNDLWLVFPEIG